jgi:hypothetical protein
MIVWLYYFRHVAEPILWKVNLYTIDESHTASVPESGSEDLPIALAWSLPYRFSATLYDLP